MRKMENGEDGPGPNPVQSSSELDDEQSQSSDARNPIMNPVVLARLFEVCELSDLFRYRLVSKEWHSVSLTRFRNEVSVQICNWPVSGLLQWRRKFIFDQLEVGDKPFECFRLFDLEFRSEPYPEPERETAEMRDYEWYTDWRNIRDKTQMYRNMSDFWVKHGHNIRKLELCQIDIICGNAFRKAILEDTPNLEELKIGSVNTNLERMRMEGGNVKSQLNLKTLVFGLYTPIPITWRQLFVHFPNIQKLELPGMDRLEFSIIVHSLEELSPSNKMNIKELTMKYAPRDEWTLTQRLLQLPHFSKLASLNLGMGGCPNAEAVIQGILHRYGKTTLKKLRMTTKYSNLRQEVASAPSWEENTFEGGPFQSITELFFQGFGYPNYHFLEQFPNLETLQLYDYNNAIFEETDLERMMDNNVRLPRLKRLALDFYLEAEEVQMLAKLMPNVESLDANLHTPAFRVVCKSWSKLRELKVFSSYETHLEDEDFIGDEALTGIVEGGEDDGDRFPSIRDLKDLQKLEISSRGRISDVSVWEGFLKLPLLRYLSFDMSKEISEEAQDALLDRFQGEPGSVLKTWAYSDFVGR